MSVKLDVIRLRKRGRVVGTRALGSEVADEIRSSDPAAKALVLDFTGVRVASSPFLDEVVCATRAAIVDHPDRHVVYGGLDEDVLDTLDLVVERRGVALTRTRRCTSLEVGGSSTRRWPRRRSSANSRPPNWPTGSS
jgi:hypothetical protein